MTSSRLKALAIALISLALAGCVYQQKLYVQRIKAFVKGDFTYSVKIPTERWVLFHYSRDGLLIYPTRGSLAPGLLMNELDFHWRNEGYVVNFSPFQTDPDFLKNVFSGKVLNEEPYDLPRGFRPGRGGLYQQQNIRIGEKKFYCKKTWVNGDKVMPFQTGTDEYLTLSCPFQTKDKKAAHLQIIFRFVLEGHSLTHPRPKADVVAAAERFYNAVLPSLNSLVISENAFQHDPEKSDAENLAVLAHYFKTPPPLIYKPYPEWLHDDILDHNIMRRPDTFAEKNARLARQGYPRTVLVAPDEVVEFMSGDNTKFILHKNNGYPYSVFYRKLGTPQETKSAELLKVEAPEKPTAPSTEANTVL